MSGGARRRSSSALADFIQRTSLAGEPQGASHANGGGSGGRQRGGAVLLQVSLGSCHEPSTPLHSILPRTLAHTSVSAVSWPQHGVLLFALVQR